jgi:MFS family permease
MDKNENSKHNWLHRTLRKDSSIAALLPIMGVVLVAFLVIGLAMPVLPLHVHNGLGLRTFVVGLVVGSQFVASLISRPWAGHHADSRGAKRAVVTGLLGATLSGLLYLVSLRFAGAPLVSVSILLLGRALLGAAESFIITGAVSWGLARVGVRNTGKVISWMGAAMFTAFAIGAPVGSTLYAGYGFVAIALATMLAPLGTMLVVAPLHPVAPLPNTRPAFAKVAGTVWLPGFGSALASVGFGAITAFVVLLFAQHGWSQGWLAYTSFATAFILARLVFGHLPDRIGGAKVALICAPIEAAGLALIWLSPRPELVLVGAVLTGFGYSLVYPGLGVEAVGRVPAQSRGLAMGAYTAFLDVALGFGTPALGLIASGAGLDAAFLASAVAALCAAAVALRLLLAPTLFDSAPHRPTRGRNESTCRDDRVARTDRFNNRSSGGKCHVEIEHHAYADA